MANADPRKSILSSSKMKFQTPHPGIRGKFVTLSVGFLYGQPRFVLNTGDPNEQRDKNMGFGNITAAMDLMTFMMALENIKAAALSPGEVKYKIQCMGHEKNSSGQRSDNPVHLSDFVCGKGKDGVVFASVISSNPSRLKIAVPFAVTDKRYHNLIGPDGQPLAPAALSVAAAIAFVNVATELVPSYCDMTYEPPVFQGAGGGNYGGGQGGGQRPAYNRPNNAPGQTARAPAPASGGNGGDDGFDDSSIPF
jgi:hypothetical protein